MSWWIVPHTHPDGEARNLAWWQIKNPVVDSTGRDDVGCDLKSYLEGVERDRHSVGRWALLASHTEDAAGESTPPIHPHEQWAKQLARRYGVVFRDVCKRESLPMTWRELLLQYRKMEWRGDMRGGRFVNGFTGEQFALPEAVEALRVVRRDPTIGAQEIRLSPADPLNLIGIILPGDRISSHSSLPIPFRDGAQSCEQPPVMSLA